jgi:hypothetical protein
MARNGARSFLDLAVKVCRLSHIAGFQNGLRTILGAADADALYAVWTPFCSVLEGIVSLDDHFNRRDATLPDPVGGEDAPFG